MGWLKRLFTRKVVLVLEYPDYNEPTALQIMLDKQKVLQERFGYDFSGMTIEERTAYIKEHSIHLNQEVNELLYELPFFKPWKDYSKMNLEDMAVQLDKAREEYVDCLHFFLNIGLALGFNEPQLYMAFMDKNGENHRRQDVGYTHEVSYRR